MASLLLIKKLDRLVPEGTSPVLSGGEKRAAQTRSVLAGPLLLRAGERPAYHIERLKRGPEALQTWGNDSNSGERV